MKRLKFEDFVLASNLIHNEKYLYTESSNFSSNSKITVFCKKHQHDFICTPNTHRHQQQGCPMCSSKPRLTRKIFLEIIKNKKDYMYELPSSYKQTDYLNIFCYRCHKVFTQKIVNHVYRGNGCPCIRGQYLSQKSFVTRSLKIHKKYDYSKSVFINARTKVIIICDKKHNFLQTPDNHLYKKQGCPICNHSNGEKMICKILDNLKIEYVLEYTFKNCKDKRQLPFDFYLKDYNILIEFDGIQHFKPVSYFGGDTKFNNIIKRDLIKTKFAFDNNIELVRYNYQQTEVFIKDDLYEKTMGGNK